MYCFKFFENALGLVFFLDKEKVKKENIINIEYCKNGIELIYYK